MYSANMSSCFFCLFILIIQFLSIKSTTSSTKFNIVLKTPGKTSPPTELRHKSVHVKYSLSNDEDQWTIVGFEPRIQVHKKAVEQISVHLCDSSIIPESIWYDDDKTIYDNAKSMLIYEWTPYSSLSPFQIHDDSGIVFNKLKSIILTVTYKKAKQVHKEQSGVILYISTQSPRYQMGAMIVGNQQSGTQFSCRSSNSPRLLYAVKKLNSHQNDGWWRIHIIRVRQFQRKLVQSVFDSEPIFNTNESTIDLVSSDLFLMNGDYLLINCEENSQTNCYFLIYYTYKSKSVRNNKICQNNEFPNLFKLIPSREIVNRHQTTNRSSIEGSTIFLIVCILLFVIWISIIIGCIIVRRIRGLVNFRTEPSSPLSAQKNKFLEQGGRNPNDHGQQRGGDADHIAQIDADQGGH